MRKLFFINFLFFTKVNQPASKDHSNLFLAIAIYLIGILLLIVEVIAPHGITGFLGIVGVLGGIILAYFSGSPLYSLYLGAFTVVALPLFFYLVYKKMQLQGGLEQSMADYTSTLTENYSNLIGKKGIAITVLRPSGIVLIDNKKVDAVSERDVIEKGQSVVVVRVEGIRIIVRKI
ncbi:MAG: NfeD family protein [Planctomycetota bacterium]